jgi:GNAT superfamily N-acetyltransferase
MANGKMVGLAIAERQIDSGALRSLCVDPAWRRQGIGTGLLARPMRFIDQDGIGGLTLQYQASELNQLCLEPILRRLGWSTPKTDFLLLKRQANQLANLPWATNHAITAPYQITPWSALSQQQLQQITQLGAPAAMMPPADRSRIELAMSIPLLHHNDLVGWVIAEQLSANSLRYSSLFIAESHRRGARGPALLAAAFAKQKQAAIPHARATIAADNQVMLRHLKRHPKHQLASIGHSRSSNWESNRRQP